MSGPAAKAPGTAARRNKSSTKAVLHLAVDHEVPSLPPAEEWLPTIEEAFSKDGDELPPRDWPEPVVRWWNDIWSSPMSNEFVDSDIHGLYLACFYMAQVLNPFLKMSDRISASKAYETAVRNFGLNPMSRRTLQWEIERSEEARDRGKKRRERTRGQEAADDAPTPTDPRYTDESTTENPFHVVS
ncbi:minor tail protein [Gordonia phage Pleakley]|uniref:Terminase small subunit n=1 Tax=Gordonia phage Pleakley TaxID=2283246 RepID=A0A345M6B9_9CAUD|nr:minor tail protein [Gordonia phage Pleakley]AXH49727.1 hypothetical protein SEA_FURY_1 [Gordonia phage Fury]AXH66040.1 hypothetical protein SEA_PLEAKLEY_1 [Gordonia phage Pleakley]